jgi:Ferritin-like domain
VSLTRRQALIGGPAAALLAASGAAAAEPSGVEQLERLLSLEHRLEAAYRAALEREAIERELGETLLEHEREHVRGVEQALRTLGRRRPRATVPPPELGTALTGRREFGRFALDLEAETVAAYQEVLATLGAPKLLQPLGSIMACGAQHQVALRESLGFELLPR